MSQRHQGTVEGLTVGKFPIFSAAMSMVCKATDDRVVNVFESGLALLHCAVEVYLPTMAAASSGWVLFVCGMVCSLSRSRELW